MKVLLIGATGLIGSSILAKLLSAGHSVVAITRRANVRRQFPQAQWVSLDLRVVDSPQQWLSHLEGVDAVINCAGVLGGSGSDSTDAAHHRGPATLFAACEQAGVKRVIHFSAVGVDRQTPSEFSRSKAEGDAALKTTALDWVILRPSVVVGRRAYGGSALFRGLAALPMLPRFKDAGELQIVQLDDVVATALFFLAPSAPARVELEIVGPRRLTFNEVVAIYRRWLGWRPAQLIDLPDWLIDGMYRLGDFLAWLGWRTPIRSIAKQEMVRGAIGDPTPWANMTAIKPQALEAALMAEPADVREKWFARLYALKPLIFAVTALFWISTALVSFGPGWEIGLGLLHESGLSGPIVPLAVIAGAASDLIIGIAIAFRRTSKIALVAALVLSFIYLILGTILVPRLWMEPLGPMLKIWSVMVLNVVSLAIVDDR
ncbi:MAG: SDR family oxidoreductase [Methylocystis sp.]|uniref:SDR family oxidoreductase n=1 Tax=Methylocystis sp. TaxID=1911079 RepID=UPI003DA4EC32